MGVNRVDHPGDELSGVDTDLPISRPGVLYRIR
jgi:hypothetical protein